MKTINIINVKRTDDCHSIQCGFKGVVNKFISNYGFFKLISYLVIIVLIYGSQLWHLTSSGNSGSKSCYVQWNKAVPLIDYQATLSYLYGFVALWCIHIISVSN